VLVCSNHDEQDVEAVGVGHLGWGVANKSDDHVQQTTKGSITRLRATHVSDAVTIKIATHLSRIQVASFVLESCVHFIQSIHASLVPRAFKSRMHGASHMPFTKDKQNCTTFRTDTET
jgi:hypothetical protein